MTNRIKKQPGSESSRIKSHDSKKDTADSSPPIFSLHHLSKDYCLSNCVADEKIAFADTLFKLSRLSWSDLRQAPRHGLGYEKISRSSFKNSKSIPNHVTEDVNIIAFRFSGKKAMVGYRDPIERKLFHIVWLDREFSLYNH